MSTQPPPPGATRQAAHGSGGPPPRPALRRRRDGNLLAGVLAGVADHLGIDVAVARILFVVLTILTSGVLVVAYLLGWVFIPEESEEEAAAPRPPRQDLGGRDPVFWVGVGTVIVGALWLLDGPFLRGPLPFFGNRNVIVPLVLIAFGVALWRAGERRPSQSYASVPGPPWATPATFRPADPPATAPPTPFAPTTPPSSPSETAMSDQDRRDTVRLDAPGASPDSPAGDTAAHGAAGAPAWTEPPSGPPPTAVGPDDRGDDWTPPPVPRQSGVLTRVTIGLAVLAVGALWWADVAGVTQFGPGPILSAALIVVGLGLVIGSVRGRGRGLILPGLLLLPLVLALQVLQPPPVDVFGPGSTIAGQRIEAPTQLVDVRDSYQVGAGELRLDLSAVELEDDLRISVQVGAGEVWIRVPDGVNVSANGRVGAGDVDLLGTRGNGVGVDRSFTDVVDPDAPTLSIEVHVGFGQIRIVPPAQ